MNDEKHPRVGTFVTICVAGKLYTPQTDSFVYNRKTFVLAEAIYTHWLGAIWCKGSRQYNVLPICPWDRDCLSWTGCARFSPFTFPLPGANLSTIPRWQRLMACHERTRRAEQSKTPEERQKKRLERQRRQEKAFGYFVIKRWKKNQTERMRRKHQAHFEREVSKRPNIRKCAFCRSEYHLIHECKAPGVGNFKKTKWKGRYYHLRKAKDTKPTGRTFRGLPRCSICRQQGHNVRTCPDPAAKEFCYENRCSNCWETGHHANACRNDPKDTSQLIPSCQDGE